MDDRFGVHSSYLAGENQYQHAYRKGQEGGVKRAGMDSGRLALTVGRMQVCCCFTALDSRRLDQSFAI